MSFNVDTLIQNETLLEHVITIGLDFDNHGGDIAVAISQMVYLEQHKPAGWRSRQGWCFVKITNAPSLEKRSRVPLACMALIEAMGHEDWLVDVLTAYYGGVHGYHSARDRAVRSHRNAAMQLVASRDSVWRTIRITGLLFPVMIRSALKRKAGVTA
jgi:hypothetical protein